MTRIAFSLLVAVMSLSASAGDSATAGEKDKAKGFAKQRSAIGTVLLRTSADAPWTQPELYAPVTKEARVLTLPGARGAFETTGGAIFLTLAGNLPELSPGPVLESALQLHVPEGNDLDFTLERGRVILENRKDTTGKVRVRIDDKNLNINLIGKDAAVALELFTRWPAGSHFSKKPTKEHQPVGELFLFVFRGKIELELKNAKHALEAPVFYHWTTLKEVEGPLPFKKAPDWIDPSTDASANAAAAHAAVEALRKAIVAKGVEQGLSMGLASEKSMVPEIALYSEIAMAKTVPVWRALEDGKTKEIRAAAANALRYWIDRGSKQDIGLYDALVVNKVKPGQAEIVLELLHGIGPDAKARPETYSTLIAYLGSDLQAIRELAHRNLVFLVPAGREIPFDAAGTAEQRRGAQTAWHKLVPEGKVPSSK